MKKILLLTLSLCLAFASLAWTNGGTDALAVTTNEPAPVYAENFDGKTALPTGWYLPTNNPTGATVSVKSDALYIESLDSITPAAAYYATDLDNYTIEADFTVLELKDTGRWYGLCFRVQDTAGWWKASLGVSSAYAINHFSATNISGGSYEEHLKGSLLKPIELNETHKITVTCYGNRVSFLMDGKYLIHTALPENFKAGVDGATIGDVGVAISGMRARIDNFKIYEATEPGLEVTYKMSDIYIPETGIVNPPVVVSDRVEAGDKPAAVTVLKVKDDGTATDASGASLGTLAAVTAQIEAKSIPAYMIENQAQAQAVIDYVDASYILDCLVMASSSNLALLRQVHEACPYVRTVATYDDIDYVRQNRKAILAQLNTYGVNVLCLPAGADKDTTFYFQRRMMTVWGTESTTRGIHSAIAAGVNGILSTGAQPVYDVYESYTKTTVIREPIVMGHRGASTLYPQNTLRGCQIAYELGAQAVEIDLHLTSDKQIVLLHDSTLDAQTSGTGAISNYTLQWLKQNVVVDCFAGVREVMPSLEEMFSYFADKDLIFLLEIKENNTEIIPLLRDLIARYDMWDKCMFMKSNDAFLAKCKQIIPEVARSRGGLSDVINPLENQASLAAAIRTMAPSSMQAFPFWYNEDGTWEYMYQFTARGWLTYASTNNGRENLDNRLVVECGATSVLTDDLALALNYIYGVKASDVTVERGKAYAPTALIEGFDGIFREACEWSVLEGGEMTKTADGYVFATAGTYVIQPTYDVDLYRENKKNVVYTIVGAPITVTVV